NQHTAPLAPNPENTATESEDNNKPPPAKQTKPLKAPLIDPDDTATKPEGYNNKLPSGRFRNSGLAAGEHPLGLPPSSAGFNNNVCPHALPHSNATSATNCLVSCSMLANPSQSAPPGLPEDNFSLLQLMDDAPNDVSDLGSGRQSPSLGDPHLDSSILPPCTASLKMRNLFSAHAKQWQNAKTRNPLRSSQLDWYLLQDNAERVADIQERRNNKPAKRKPKPGLGVQPGVAWEVASAAVVDFQAFTLAEGPYKTSLDPWGGQYQHHAVRWCMAEGLFYAPHAPVVVYHKYFRPALPIITVAFVLTIMQACIEEWRTGRFVAKHLNASNQFNMFTAHLLGLEEYSTRAPSVQCETYNPHYRENVAQPISKQPVLQTYTTRDKVWPDSESKDEGNAGEAGDSNGGKAEAEQNGSMPDLGSTHVGVDGDDKPKSKYKEPNHEDLRGTDESQA
ncbi:hypothetical protein RHS02_07657, partial [Rhizoctonia solani]